MNTQQAPRIVTSPTRSRTTRRTLAAAALILLPFAVLGQGATAAHAATSLRVTGHGPLSDAHVKLTLPHGEKVKLCLITPYGTICITL